jgi:fucose 4-O-acetylase-like acetyltransferase
VVVTQVNNRIVWLDNLKAIGIILVAFGHNLEDSVFLRSLYSFHMPLFFFLSGVLYNGPKYKFVDYLKHKLATRIKPYFILSFVTFAFWFFVVMPLSVRGESFHVDQFKAFLGLFYGIGTGVWRNQMAVALWFIPCLFCVEIVYDSIARFCRNERSNIVVAVIIVAMIGCFISIARPIPFRLPWSLDMALIAVVFFAVGHICKDFWGVLQNQRSSGIYYVASFLFFILGIMLSEINGRVDMISNRIMNPFLFLLVPFCFIVPLIYITRNLRSNWFLFIGQNTLPIIAYHLIALFFVRAVYYLITGQIQKFEHLPVIENTVIVTIQFVVLYPIILIHNKYLGWISK